MYSPRRFTRTRANTLPGTRPAAAAALGEGRDKAQPQRCDACFTGEYPTRLTDLIEKEGEGSLSLVASR